MAEGEICVVLAKAVLWLIVILAFLTGAMYLDGIPIPIAIVALAFWYGHKKAKEQEPAQARAARDDGRAAAG